MEQRLRVAIVGTQGVPNAYGGFETLAEFLVEHLSDEFDVSVYCSSADQKVKPPTYHGARLRYLRLSSHGAVGMVYDSLTLAHACFTHDVVLFLGFGAGYAAPIIPGLKKKLVLNFGGLDWKREKWSRSAMRVIKECERLLVQNSSVVVADNELIADYVKSTYGIEPEFVAYGGDQAIKRSVTSELIDRYSFLSGPYALAVARIQPDNNIDMLLDGFPPDAGYPLVFIGNWSSSDYGVSVRERYRDSAHLILLDAIYERPVLDVIRSNCHVYIHGHSAGGTNPSLCEAMYLGLPVVAYASGYNERTMAGHGWFFKNRDQLRDVISRFRLTEGREVGRALQQVAKSQYTWSAVAAAYAQIFKRLRGYAR